MLSARAYSFRQKSRLAISLSSVGGYTNLVALLACGAVVSHVTGNATRAGSYLGEGKLGLALYFLFLIGAFFLGAVVSALITESARRRGRPSKYVWPMALEALLLLLFAIGSAMHGHVEPTETFWQYALTGVACLAMGLQNATITRISGSTVRTTHVTGVVTDLGIESVQFGYWWLDNLRGRKANRGTRAGRLARVSQRHPTFLRLLLLASILISFLLGATLGTFIFIHWPSIAMVPPIAFLVFIIGMDLYRPIADVRELDLLADPELKAGGIIKSMLPPELGIYRFVCGAKRSHRAPDFQSWVEHLPEHWRVVILAVIPQTRFDTNAVLDLQAALKTLRSQGRRLVLCGLTPTQIRSLEAQDVARMMDVSNLCPDLEFAVARGLALVQEMKSEAKRVGPRVVTERIDEAVTESGAG